MDEHDEAFEAIPWERFSAVERRMDPRALAGVVAVIALVGVSAFALRRSAPPEVAIAGEAPAAPVVSPPSSTTTTTTTTVSSDQGLWAAPVVGPRRAEGVGARFLVGLLAGVGLDVVAVHEVAVTEGPDGTTVMVEAVGPGADGGLLRLGMEVEVDPDGSVRAWRPVTVAAPDVRPLTPGAVPPADVLDGLVRTAARWGTTEEVLRSGIGDDRWWVEFSVRLADGSVIPLVVWEDYPA